MKLKGRSEIIFSVASLVSIVMLVIYVRYLVSVNVFELTRPSAFEQIALFLTFLISAIYFLCRELFEKISKKFIERLLLLQCTAALSYSLADFRICYLDLNFVYLFFEFFIFGAFFVLLYISESFNMSGIPGIIAGYVYIFYSIITSVKNDYISIPNIAICVSIALYFLYYFDFDSLLNFDSQKREDSYITDVFEDTYTESVQRSHSKKLIKYIPIAVIVILFISSLSYLLLINFDIIYDIISHKFAELLCYGSLSMLMAIFSRALVKRFGDNSKAVKIVLPYLFALLATVFVICLNSAYHFIDFNSMFNWIDPVSYSVFIKSDLRYSYLGGWLRYPAVLLFNLILQYAFCHIKGREKTHCEHNAVADTDDNRKHPCNIIEFRKPDFEE